MSLSLRQRILWWSGASTIVIVLAAFLLVDGIIRRTIERDQRENLIAGARLVSELQASEIDGSLDRTAGLATAPTLRAADECRKPATIPQCHPKRPAIGASVVPNKAASNPDGSAAPHGLASEPRKTPAMIGTMFAGCLPYAAKPTMVKIAPMTGMSISKGMPARVDSTSVTVSPPITAVSPSSTISLVVPCCC